MPATAAAPARTIPLAPAPRHRGNVTVLPTHCSTCNLRGVCLPCGLDAAGLQRVGDAVYTRRRVKQGDTLFHAGAGFDSIYAVRSGFFKATVVLEDGREQVTGFHMAGEVLGLDGIANGRHTTDLVALEDSEVCVIPYASFEEPGLQRQLHKVMGRELLRDQGVMTLLGTMKAEERLAAFLLNLSQRFTARGFSPSEFHLRMKREEIGSYLGLSLETVSRLFSRFHEEGLLNVQQKHVRILDIPGLKALMHPVSA